MTKLENFFNQRIDTVDTNTRFLLANQEFNVQQIKRKLNGFYNKYVTESQTSKEDSQLPQDQLMQKKAFDEKKRDVLKKLNEQIGIQ